MEAKNFSTWFEKLFVPSVAPLLETGPAVLFVDGHHSHLTLDLIQLARSKGVHLVCLSQHTTHLLQPLVCLPPHTTHMLQPLDVGVYGPVKKTWKTLIKQHNLETQAEKIVKEDFPGRQGMFCGCGGYPLINLIDKLYQQSFKREHYKGGFRVAGLSPFSRDAIPTSKLAASIPFQEPEVDPSNEFTPHQEATTCNKCGCQVTTVELTVAAYFSKYLQCQNKPRQRDYRRVKPVAYGEVLTRDEVVQRLEQEELEKAEKAAEKARE